MTDIINEINQEIYLAAASTLAGIFVTKICNFLYPDALILYTKNFCKRKPRELDPTKKLPQLWEERFIDDNNNHKHDCAPPLGYKNYKYAKNESSKWVIKVDDTAVSQKTKIHIYNTLSTHPDTGYHYFYFRIKYNNTESPKLYAYNRLFHRGDNVHIVNTDITENFDEPCFENNTIYGSMCFKSHVGENIKGKEIGSEQIGLIFGMGSGEYTIEEAYISDRQINIKKCGFMYLFWRCYNKKPEYIESRP